MTVIVAAGVAVEVGRSLREGFFMFWETLWPLVLGFGLSGAVQAFVSHEQMERVMGNHRPAAVARASGLGMVSSSCSYAATAMAKSLFAKGADFVDAMIFMFASTNLVIELGIVLVVLMGWQFAAAEFVGGAIMIVLLALSGGIVIGARRAAAARRHLAGGEANEHQAMAGVSEQTQAELDLQPWRRKLTSKAAWSDAASYTMADLTMLRRELAVGYVIAGFLAVVVPTRAWNVVFLHGHGVWTSIENALVGPLIAIVSFVCSVGNVALGAALWKGGISFGGVISFVFADLITLPLLLIYRKYYGWRLTLRLLAWFWAIMATAGLVVEGLFSAVGLVPTQRTATIAATHFEWNYTTVLNLVALALFGVLYWLYRNRDRLGGGAGLATDPVCGMQVRTTDAPARSSSGGHTVWFCSDRCRERFDADPARYTSQSPSSENPDSAVGATDPVCGMTVDPETSEHHRRHAGQDYSFCGKGCADAFDADPTRLARGSELAAPLDEDEQQGATKRTGQQAHRPRPT